MNPDAKKKADELVYKQEEIRIRLERLTQKLDELRNKIAQREVNGTHPEVLILVHFGYSY